MGEYGAAKKIAPSPWQEWRYLLYELVERWLLFQAQLPNAFVQKLTCGDVVVPLGVRGVDTTFQAGQVHIAAWMQEKRRGIAWKAHGRLVQIDHAVDGRFQSTIGMAVQHVTDVDDDLVGTWGYIHPCSVGVFGL